MIVIVQVADLSHENFRSSRVMRWWLSRLSSRSGAKSSRERKPKWLPDLGQTLHKTAAAAAAYKSSRPFTLTAVRGHLLYLCIINAHI